MDDRQTYSLFEWNYSFYRHRQFDLFRSSWCIHIFLGRFLARTTLHFFFSHFPNYCHPCLTYEQLRFQEFTNGDLTIDQRANKPALGITFGWDIMLDRLQSFVLRTNLRYFPSLQLDLADGESFYYDNIEFNFIQLVVYPGRMFGKKK